MFRNLITLIKSFVAKYSLQSFVYLLRNVHDIASCSFVIIL